MEGELLKFLIDTNVAITYMSGREDKYTEETVCIFEYCANGKIKGYIAQHSISVIWYYARRLPAQIRREWLLNICKVLTVIGASHEGVLDAIRRDDFTDFEDCLQDVCATEANCDYIVTANVKDFKYSIVPAITPKQCLEMV